MSAGRPRRPSLCETDIALRATLWAPRTSKMVPLPVSSELYESGALLPCPEATLAGPTFEEWLDSTSRVVVTDKGGNR